MQIRNLDYQAESPQTMPHNNEKKVILLYIVLTISILMGRESPAYFENSRGFVDKHDYSTICCYQLYLQIIPRAVRMGNTPLANSSRKQLHHLLDHVKLFIFHT